jgi:NADH:ubiquinone oxidoreductase subunit 4 (subunit M)
MIQKVFLGNTNNITASAHDVGIANRFVLVILVIIIVVIGVYPSLMLDITKSTSEFILSKMFVQ